MKILFTGGGSGGHIYPIVAIIKELRRVHAGKDLELFYVGPKDPFCDIILSKEKVKIKHITAGKIRRYFNPLAFFQNIIDVLVKIPLGIIQSFLYIFIINPDLIFSKGGYGSYPVAVSGWLLGVPIFLQESDILPGMASRKVAVKALEIFVSFPKTEYFSPKKMILVGNPIRQEVLGGSKEEAFKIFGLTGKKPVILILGGSQGAQRVNDKVLDILPELIKDYELIHQTGERNLAGVKKEAAAVVEKGEEIYYHSIGFLDDNMMAHAYAAADLIISRAGSGSIFEIAAVKKPAILIPLPEAAQNHQVRNAYAYAGAGAALVMEENNFTTNFFRAKIKDMLNDPKKMAFMSDAAGEFSRPKAARIIAEYIINYLTR